MSSARDKNTFRTYQPLSPITGKLLIYLSTVNEIELGKLGKGIIGTLPIHKPVFIDNFKIKDITRKHGFIPIENLVLTANMPTFYIRGEINGREYITLAKDFGTSCFILSTRKYEEFYVVTFFEPASRKYLESIKKRGKVVYIP